MTSLKYKKALIAGLIVALSASQAQAGWFDWFPSLLGGQNGLFSKQLLVATIGVTSIGIAGYAYRCYCKKKVLEANAKLLEAIEADNYEKADSLLRSWANANACDSEGKPALYHALKRLKQFNKAKGRSITLGAKNIVQLLLEDDRVSSDNFIKSPYWHDLNEEEKSYLEFYRVRYDC